ncbi:MAG: hypothetical protein H7144_15695 [Burkholderiales bacterium]|nr:hypothetical protein [Phycisphaerae bacterium]
MPPDQPLLKLRAVRQILRLVAEMRRRGDDPAQWRPFMAKSLLRYFEAELVISTEIYVQPTSQPGQWSITDIGWGADTTGSEWRIESTTRENNPEIYNLVINRRAEPADHHMAIAPAKPLYRGSAFMISSMPLAHISAVDQLGVHRAHGSPHFTNSDHRLLRLLHLELARFWRADVLRQTRDPHQSLAPRLRQTVDLLVAGKSEKEIAHAIGISPHTVHNYVKALHKRFNVASRGELIAAATQRTHDFVPRLSVNVFPAGKKKSGKPIAAKKPRSSATRDR